MKTRIQCLLLAASLLIAAPLRAQIVNDGATNTLNNVTTNFTGDVTVGTNGSFTLLVLSDNALLTNSVNGLIGRNATAKSNEVQLLSASARWRMGGSLFVGSNGASSRLLVSSGAWLENHNGTFGNRIGSSNNFAFVTDGGSIWNNRSDLTVGFSGRDNQLIVSNGGWVTDRYGYVGRQPGSSNNFVLVTGSGSVWSNAFDMYVGFNERGNRLVIEAGGLAHCDNGYVGDFGSASNNEALVTGPGSLWTNRSFLTIGSQAGRNRLVVSNGATVFSGTGVMGGSSALSNQVIVTSAGSVWSNETFLYLGAGSVGNRADVSDGGWLACNDGYVGSGFTANSNTVVLTDSGSGWNNLASLFVGDGGSGNVLIASNGATVLSSNAFIGASTSLGNNNFALLTGAGTVWSNRSDLTLGRFSVGNRLVANDGALVFAGSNVVLGLNTSANSNSILLSDLATRLKHGPLMDFTVGSNGSFNQLVISNGAAASCRLGYLGRGTTGGTNSVIVTGPGSAWALDVDVIMGSSTTGNRLTISNGGFVSSLDGNLAGFTNNVIVTGADSVWSNQSSLYVGDTGSGNHVVVTNGGLVVASDRAILGYNVSSTDNRIIVDGGTLRAVNPAVNGTLDVRRGNIALNAGVIEVDQLLLTNMTGRFDFNGGLLSVKKSTSMHAFQVGNGVSPATFNLAGNGNHSFSGVISVGVSSNATLTGNGTLSGRLFVFNGGTLRPGASVGKFILSNSPALQGTTIMEISKDGATLTNDQIQVIGALTYGGSLTVSNMGSSALAAGDRFPLFSASSYAGGFTKIILPPLAFGLDWTNKLSLGGSIEVVGVALPKFSSITVSGTNVVISGSGGPTNAPYTVLTATDVAQPSSNWVSVATNQFGAGGEFSFTNGVAPGEPQRFFRIRTP